jgi:hypothetical protein
MRKPQITLAFNEHRNRRMVRFQKKTGIFVELNTFCSSKTTEIYTHVSKQSFAKTQSLLERFLSDKKLNKNNL